MITCNESIYPSFDGASLPFRVFCPENIYPDTEEHPAVVFFFGGGWVGGSIDQFQHQAEAFAAQGFVAFTPFYRTWREHTDFRTSMQDAFAFLSFLGEHHRDFSVSRDRIILSGGSSGGHLALTSALIRRNTDEWRIRALILFNPVVDTSPLGVQSEASLNQPWNPRIFSPLHFLRSAEDGEMTGRIPPMILFHGEEDHCMEIGRVKLFCDLAKQQNADVTLCTYPHREHGFFNYRDGKNPDYRDTLDKSLAFARRILA